MVKQPQLYHLPYIYPEDFPQFFEILRGDPAFPANYDAWEKLLWVREEQLWRGGKVPIFTGVKPAGYRQFMVSSAGIANLKTLGTHVALLGSALLRSDRESTTPTATSTPTTKAPS